MVLFASVWVSRPLPVSRTGRVLRRLCHLYRSTFNYCDTSFENATIPRLKPWNLLSYWPVSVWTDMLKASLLTLCITTYMVTLYTIANVTLLTYIVTKKIDVEVSLTLYLLLLLYYYYFFQAGCSQAMNAHVRLAPNPAEKTQTKSSCSLSKLQSIVMFPIRTVHNLFSFACRVEVHKVSTYITGNRDSTRKFAKKMIPYENKMSFNNTWKKMLNSLSKICLRCVEKL